MPEETDDDNGKIGESECHEAVKRVSKFFPGATREFWR